MFLNDDEFYDLLLFLKEEEAVADGDKAIVFLYTVSPGPCSKSHGFNAAR
jgi:DNA mismatch repair ATPase MutS